MDNSAERLNERSGVGNGRLVISIAAILVFVAATLINLDLQPSSGTSYDLSLLFQVTSLLVLGLASRNIVVAPIIFLPALLAGILDSQMIVPGDMERAGSEIVAAIFLFLPAILLSVTIGWLVHRVTSRR